MTSAASMAVDPHLIRVARGDAPADVLLQNGRIVNVFTGEIEQGHVAISGGRIAGVGTDYASGRRVIDLRGSYVAPGFIDAHMHVESTFLPPSEFVRLAVPHGTTGVVLDPHEIANVLGLEGIRLVMDDAVGLPINAWFALSSCVPSSPLETSGARLEANDLAPLLSDSRVVGLAEMMNFPGVIAADAAVLEKIALGLSHGVVDGHCPGLTGPPLQAYVASGITSDHECTTAAEALEKVRRGLRVFIREGSAARNLEALLPAVTPATRDRFAFCTDDRHPGDLAAEGHIDHVVRKAVSLGLDPIAAITMATLVPAQHYRRAGVGAVAPGYQADLVVFDDLRDIRPRIVVFEGTLVAENGAYLGPSRTGRTAGRGRKPLRLPASLAEESFAVPCRLASDPHALRNIRVIGMHPHQLVTDRLQLPGRCSEGRFVADATQDILKLAVIERHTGTGRIGLAFVQGFALTSGALASTVGHDSHNLAIVGANDSDMLVAAKALEACGGGQCVVRDGRVLAILPLPIAGLMSDQPAETVIEQQTRLLAAASGLGCPHADPFMPLSFLSLPVIPHLKLTDLGLVDVDMFQVVPLEC